MAGLIQDFQRAGWLDPQRTLDSNNFPDQPGGYISREEWLARQPKPEAPAIAQAAPASATPAPAVTPATPETPAKPTIQAPAAAPKAGVISKYAGGAKAAPSPDSPWTRGDTTFKDMGGVFATGQPDGNLYQWSMTKGGKTSQVMLPDGMDPSKMSIEELRKPGYGYVANLAGDKDTSGVTVTQGLRQFRNGEEVGNSEVYTQNNAIQSYLGALRDAGGIDVANVQRLIGVMPNASPGRLGETIASMTGAGRSAGAGLPGLIQDNNARYTADQQVKIANINALVHRFAEQEANRRTAMSAGATVEAARLHGAGSSAGPRLINMKRPVMSPEGFQVGEEEIPVAYDKGQFYAYGQQVGGPQAGAPQLPDAKSNAGRTITLENGQKLTSDGSQWVQK